MTIGCIIQARLGSTRLPRKVIQQIDKNNTVLDFVLNQLTESKKIEKIIIATTNLAEDKKIIEIANRKNIDYFCGSSNDVLDRYYKCAKKFDLSQIIRITSDCPLMDPKIIDELIEIFQNNSYDYASNVHPITFPVGIAVEIFTFDALYDAWKNANLQSEHEHVTPYLYNNKEKFNLFNLENTINLSSIRITVDYQSDLDLIKQIVSKITNRPILMSDILDLYHKESKMFEINQNYKINEGYIKSLENDKEFLQSKENK
jgi:spore coat polysaccharide biosynthesis protein SpsF